MAEEWKTCSANPAYEVSSMGRVRSKDRWAYSSPGKTKRGYYRKMQSRMLSCFIKGTGYPSVRLGKVGQVSVHSLVATEFCPGYKPGLAVNHKNGIRDDNRRENLEWVTYSENSIHGFRENGRDRVFEGEFGVNHPTSKPVIGTCLVAGKEVYYECAYAARHDGLDPNAIGMCCRGLRGSHKRMAWRFALPGDGLAYRAERKNAA